MQLNRIPSFRNFFPSVLGVFTSLKLAIGLFALFICILILAMVSRPLASALAIPIRIMLAMLFLALVLCTLRKLRSMRAATLFIHFGSIVAIIGFSISSFGFVATVNIYEGGATDSVYRWDVMSDRSLGYDLSVTKIHMEYYPIPVKIGVLRNGRKTALIETKTGDSFIFEDYLVRVDSLDPASRNLRLDLWSRAGKSIGTLFTSGPANLLEDLPLDFKLVAFKNPNLKRVWVDLELRMNGKVIAAGSSEVNRPFVWQGLRFFNTQVAKDPFGRAYAGIQIRKDPGIPYVYAGFAILCLGLLLALGQWHKGGRGGRS